MRRRTANLWLALTLLLTLTAGAAGTSAATLRMVCRMSGDAMPVSAPDASPAGCCAAEAVHSVPTGAVVGYKLALPGCCDIEQTKGAAKAPAVVPVAEPEPGVAWAPAPPFLFAPPPEEAVLVYLLADLTGPRAPPKSRHPARAPPALS